MKTRKKYPSSVMLAGEYAVLTGGSALTIPFNKFTARVRKTDDFPPGKEADVSRSAIYLRNLYRYIRDLPEGSFNVSPDMDLFSGHHNEYWLEINIPPGYGPGSSGAVSAAIYDLFFPGAGEASLVHRKEDLAAIESYFYPSCSGVEALTCHAATSLHIKDDGSIQRVAFDPAEIPYGYRLFLLDSGERSDPGPLVEQFHHMMKDPGFESSVRNEYMVINNKLIDALLGKRDADPGLLMRILSDYQFNHFRKMIPPA